MLDLSSTFLLVIVASIWGITNPLLKITSAGIEKCAKDPRRSWFFNFYSELKFLFLNWKYLLVYGINQIGSLLYYYSLGLCDLSIAGPLTNTLTFLITYLSGVHLFGEKEEESTIKKIGLIFVW